MSNVHLKETPFQVVPPPVFDASRLQHTSLRGHLRYVPGTVQGVILVQTSNLRQMLLCVPAGQGLPRHLATCDVTVRVIEGAGVLTVDGEEPVHLHEGSYLFMPAGQPHAVVAEKNLALLATFTQPNAEIRFL